MKVAVLFSGGKDSTFALFTAVNMGFEVKYLVTIEAEKDSKMYHTSIENTYNQSKSLDVPILYRKSEKRFKELERVLDNLDIDGVVTGAVESEYQKEKVDMVCEKLGLKHFSPLWRKDPEKLLEEMIDAGFDIIITSVAAEGLDESWLGRRINKENLKELNKKYGLHLTGEGGEFETLVLDCPLFKKKLEILNPETNWDPKTSSGEMNFESKLVG